MQGSIRPATPEAQIGAGRAIIPQMVGSRPAQRWKRYRDIRAIAACRSTTESRKCNIFMTFLIKLAY
jgi:hypothetical protein